CGPTGWPCCAKLPISRIGTPILPSCKSERFTFPWHVPGRGAVVIELSERQEKILEIVKNKGPITGEQIAEALQLTRATLRPDLAILTMVGYLDARPRVGYFYVGRSNNSLIAEEMRKMRVGDYKAVPVMVEETTSAYEAIVTMFVQDVGTLFVTKKDGNLAGVISRKDLLRSAMGKQPLQDIPVSIIM